MRLIPAIDLRGGKAVRLRQGDYSQETIFGDDPVAVARRWADEGAKFLHLVDLDGAREGRPVNTAVIGAIVREVGVPCQLGGGLRNDEALRLAFNLGVARVIVGTQAVRQPDWFRAMSTKFPNRLILGLDAKNGLVATAGWLDVSAVSAIELAEQVANLPLAGIVYTDIAKDGMMAGPNFDATALLARHSPHEVMASGGIARPEDVLELRRRGIKACILGRSLYEGTIVLPALLRTLAELDGQA